MDRQEAADRAKETLRILGAGRYRCDSGKWVWIREALEQAVAGTVGYDPAASVHVEPLPRHPTQITVANQTSLAAAQALVADGYRVVSENSNEAIMPLSGGNS